MYRLPRLLSRFPLQSITSGRCVIMSIRHRSLLLHATSRGLFTIYILIKGELNVRRRTWSPCVVSSTSPKRSRSCFLTTYYTGLLYINPEIWL